MRLSINNKGMCSVSQEDQIYWNLSLRVFSQFKYKTLTFLTQDLLLRSWNALNFQLLIYYNVICLSFTSYSQDGTFQSSLGAIDPLKGSISICYVLCYIYLRLSNYDEVMWTVLYRNSIIYGNISLPGSYLKYR